MRLARLFSLASLASLASAGAATACARAGLPEQVVEHVEVPEQPPQTVPLPVPPVEAPPPPPIDLTVRDEDDTPAPLSGYWAATFNHTARYAEAVANMRAASADYNNASVLIFESDGGLPTAQQFQAATAAIDLLNRRYAAVYYAPDATASQRIDTLEEVSSILLRWAARLDEVGLDKVPASFRTNGAIALTFEDVVHGPSKRWRGEGLTLASTCVARAKTDSVNSPASKSCADLVKSHAKTPMPPHQKTQPECACVAGDPLCSASMSGWCKPKP